jgi:conserved oligomeric Golgi complex subunit 3
VPRRAKSFSQPEPTAQKSHTRPARARRKRRRAEERTLEAVTLHDQEVELDEADEPLLLPGADEELLLASQDRYMLYHDQLALTERHLDRLIDDTDTTLRLLEQLTTSFRSVDEQTTTFRAQCEDLILEQKRLQELADSVGTELHYYGYLDNVTRRLNAPGASRLVDDDAFGEILDNLDMCIAFMAKNPAYRDAETYQARYRSLLTKALHLLEVGFTGRLDKVSAEISKQIAATQSESARHALAYGRFEQMMTDTHSLIPNVQKVILHAYDQVGIAKEGLTLDIYANTANDLFQSYLAARDRDLKPITQHDLQSFKNEAKAASVETGARNFVKQCFETSFNEANLFAKLFRIDPKWNINSDSAYVAMKSHQRAVMNGSNITPLATNLQAVFATAEIRTVCNVVGWITNEYVLADYEEDEGVFMAHSRELAERLLTEYLWRFTDALFEAEIAKSITKAPVVVEALKVGQATNGNSTAVSGTYPPVRRSLELLSMFDDCMPKERCVSLVVLSLLLSGRTDTCNSKGTARLSSKSCEKVYSRCNEPKCVSKPSRMALMRTSS